MPCIHIKGYTLLSSFFLITGKASIAFIPKTQKPQTKWYPPTFIFNFRVSKTFYHLDVMSDAPLSGGAPLLPLEGV